MMEDIETRIKKVIADMLGVDDADMVPNASIVNDLGADDLDEVELIIALEEEFDIEIPDDEAEKLKTIGQVIDYINAHTKEE
jgi:acyl carrier protein